MAEELLQTDYSNASSTVMPLRTQVIRGGFWVFALRITNQVFGLARTIVLARLLAPEDFGLFGIALLAMSALETFSQTGFNTALIQKKEDTKTYLDTAWTVQVIRGIILALIAFTIAPYVAAFFDAPAAKPILQVIAFSVLIGSFTNIGVIYFQKELKFHKQFVYSLSGTLADIGVAIPAAFLLRSVWAIVFGLLAGNLVRIVVSYFIRPYRPHLGFNAQQFKELFGFGKWVLGSSVLVFLLTQGDDAFVGKVLGVTALGFYQLAYRLSNLPATEITHVISQVTFPAYSKLQDDLPRLREAYLKVLQITAFLSFPIAGLIFVLAPDFTRIFLGEKWMPMVPAMQVLVFWGLIRSIGATTGPVFLASGKPKILTKLLLLQLIMLIILIYPLMTRLGILGVSLAVFLASLGANTLAFYAAIKITNCGVYNFGRMVNFPLISSLIAIISIFLLKICWVNPNKLSTPFVLSLICYGMVYVGVNYLLDRFSTYRIQHLVKGLFFTSQGL